MLKPSYAELMDVLNKNSQEDVTSRYTVVIAAAKRARQLIDGDETMLDEPIEGKPLSEAVEEIREGKIKIVPEGEGTVVKPRRKIREEIKEEVTASTSVARTETNYDVLFDNIDDEEEEKELSDSDFDEDSVEELAELDGEAEEETDEQ